MAKMSKTIVFFGSGPVAAQSLKKLAEDGPFEIEAVITKPRPAHHKEVFPVLALARDLGLKTLTTADAAELSELFARHNFRSQLGVVIDYGIIIGQSVIDSFPLGIVNSHFSLLPRWRGPDPITFAISSGDSETGVSLMLIVAALDEGPLLVQRSIKIAARATAMSLTQDLINLSHQLLITALPAYQDGRLKPHTQPEVQPTYSRKLTKDDGKLDPKKSAEQLEREVRAHIEWPRSRANLGSYQVIVTEAHVHSGQGKPGSIWLGPGSLGIYTAKGILIIDKLVLAGKKEMTAAAFLAGHDLSAS